jgi:hypothetical protein
MKMYLNHRANLQCSHGGQVKIIPPLMRSMYVVESPVVTDLDLLQRARIVGCGQTGPGVKPCTNIVQIVRGKADKITVDDEIPILDTLQALTDGSPQGMVQAIDNGNSNATIGSGSRQMVALLNASRSGALFCET